MDYTQWMWSKTDCLNGDKRYCVYGYYIWEILNTLHNDVLVIRGSVKHCIVFYSELNISLSITMHAIFYLSYAQFCFSYLMPSITVSQHNKACLWMLYNSKTAGLRVGSAELLKMLLSIWKLKIQSLRSSHSTHHTCGQYKGRITLKMNGHTLNLLCSFKYMYRKFLEKN